MSMPGVSEPDWETLEIKENLELFKEIYRAWIGSMPPKGLEQRMAKGVDNARSGKYRMRVTRMELRQTIDDSIAAPETILGLDYCKKKDVCMDETSTWEIDKNLAKLASSGPPHYSSIGPGPGETLIRFKGQPYFVHLGYDSFDVDGVVRYSNTVWDTRNLCSISNH